MTKIVKNFNFVIFEMSTFHVEFLTVSIYSTVILPSCIFHNNKEKADINHKFCGVSQNQTVASLHSSDIDVLTTAVTWDYLT